MRETNQTDKLGRSGEPDKQTKIVRRSNRQIRLFVSVCLVTTLLTPGAPRPERLEVIASYLAHHACTSANWACWPRGWLAKPDCDHHFDRSLPCDALLDVATAAGGACRARNSCRGLAQPSSRTGRAPCRFCPGRLWLWVLRLPRGRPACHPAHHGLCNLCAISLDAAATSSAVARICLDPGGLHIYRHVANPQKFPYCRS